MPRSPSRDLSDRFTGKRGYFRRPDALRRARFALVVVALLAAAAWAVVDAAKPAQRVQYAHSHGPLANVHAAFDNNCEACHKAHGVSLNPADVFKARDRWHDLTCEKCHAGPQHHKSMEGNAEAMGFHNRCSNCHHDHLGRLNSLVRLADKDCNWCHADLNKYYDAEKSLTKAAGEPPYASKVTNFVTDHPEFRSLGEKDEKGHFRPVHSPRTLEFSHAVHMAPGQAYATGGALMTVARLRQIGGPAAVARYAPGAADGTAVQLSCASCHALDAGAGTPAFDAVKATLGQDDPARAVLPPRAEGAYFLPVNFEAHCRSCHPLAANEGVTENGAGKFLLPRFDVPHRVQPSDLRGLLKAGYLKELIAGGKPLTRPKPELGGRLDPAAPATPRTPDEEARWRIDEAERLTATAERILLTARNDLKDGQDGCYKCHVAKPGADRKSIAAVPDRTVWFKHAKFNHASHRGASCATCHPGIPETGEQAAKPENRLSREAARLPEPVQIVGANVCRSCHAPAGTAVKLPDGGEVAGGGARHACTDCHRYHNGDHPLEGRGAAARDTGKPLSLKDWLTGSIKKD